MVCNFQNGESFSPFLLISWDPTRWGDVLVEGVGYGLFKPLVKWIMFGSTPQENFSSSRGIPRDEEKWGETLAIFKIPRDGEKFSWGGRGVVKSHEEKKIPRDFSPIYANAAPS